MTIYKISYICECERTFEVEAKDLAEADRLVRTNPDDYQTGVELWPPEEENMNDFEKKELTGIIEVE